LKLITQRTMFKLLIERSGIAPTTDPYPGIVEICGYDIQKIVYNWQRLYRVKLVR
jgi:hypothetical protein